MAGDFSGFAGDLRVLNVVFLRPLPDFWTHGWIDRIEHFIAVATFARFQPFSQINFTADKRTASPCGLLPCIVMSQREKKTQKTRRTIRESVNEPFHSSQHAVLCTEFAREEILRRDCELPGRREVSFPPRYQDSSSRLPLPVRVP